MKILKQKAFINWSQQFSNYKPENNLSFNIEHSSRGMESFKCEPFKELLENYKPACPTSILNKLVEANRE